MGFVTTHVLDTARGVPAAGAAVRLYRVDAAGRQMVRETRTNSDGRCDSPVLPQEEFSLGEYELEFDAGAYLRDNGLPDSFLGVVTLRFRISEDSHYHVPLLLSPFGYSTYRGS